MTIKELYELAKEENAEDYEVVICSETGDEDWEVTGLAILHASKKIFI